MATFTMELAEVVETIYNESWNADLWQQPYNRFTYDQITYGNLPVLPDATKIGLGHYPIFDENYRPILNGKIVQQYFDREIGAETIDKFILYLERRMNQIMPYYNDLYATTKLEFNPLETINIRTQGKNTSQGTEDVSATGESQNDSEAKSRAVNSQTPQTFLQGSGNYATAATDSKSGTLTSATTSQDSNSVSNTEAESDTLVTGYQAYPADLLTKYRNTIINIDTMIIADLEDLFMQISNNGDTYLSYNAIGW